jgi:hypothetical protein
MKLNLILLGWLLASMTSFGIAPDTNLVCETDTFIERSWNIVLARVISAEVSDCNSHNVVDYCFEVVETLRGDQKENFCIRGHRMEFNHDFSSFKNHTEELFWKRSIGRSHVYEDTAVVPRFSVGWTYLIFLDKPYHVKAFEEVSRDSDKWLIYVKNKIAEQKGSEGDIKRNAIQRQVQFYISELLNGYPDIDKDDKLSIIKRCYEYVENHPDTTNSEVESFFMKQLDDLKSCSKLGSDSQQTPTD